MIPGVPSINTMFCSHDAPPFDSLFTAQHSDWKCHKWCDVDTTILMNATAVQQDQLRNLPQFCSEWDVFMRLSQEVTEIQVCESSRY